MLASSDRMRPLPSLDHSSAASCHVTFHRKPIHAARVCQVALTRCMASPCALSIEAGERLVLSSPRLHARSSFRSVHLQPTSLMLCFVTLITTPKHRDTFRRELSMAVASG